MSYVVALPEMMSAAATDVASVGSLVATANQGVAGATTGVLAAAEDEVSAVFRIGPPEGFDEARPYRTFFPLDAPDRD